MSKNNSKQVLGPLRSRKGTYPCGMCGMTKQMSKAHVPPRCAGNEMLVKRYRYMVKGNEADAGRGDMGGIHIYGLCDECNGLAGVHDGAYGQFANHLRSKWIRSWSIQAPALLDLPAVPFDPGAVVRSILLGMCATGGLIHRDWPQLPLALAKGDPLKLPSEIAILVALARGMTARVSGPTAGFHIMGPHVRRDDEGVARGIHSVASVYFPPVAWELIHVGDTTLLDDGWVDVSGWTQIPPGEVHQLNLLVPSLPATCHPWHHPTRSEGWTELLNSEFVPIVECDNIEGGNLDLAAPLTVGKRAHVSIDEFNEMARRRGLVAPPAPSG
jgi:hypothetical protein